MRIDDYIVNGKVARNRIAIDIKRRIISRSDIEKLVSDKRIRSAFLNETYNKKVPKKEWTKLYLNELTNVAIAECFNRDYLLYLDEVADFVTKAKFKKIVLGTVIVVLVIIAGVVVLIYTVKNFSRTSSHRVIAYNTETNHALDRVELVQEDDFGEKSKRRGGSLYVAGKENSNRRNPA